MVKEARKGQKLIYDENQSTIFYYSVAVLASIGLRSLFCFVFGGCETSFIIYFGISCLIQIATVMFMRQLASAKVDDKGHVFDAGSDLNDPESFGEYCKDTVILTVITQVLSFLTNYAFALLLVFPGVLGYKLIFGVIIPWATAPSAEPEYDEKKMRKMERKREKIVYRR